MQGKPWRSTAYPKPQTLNHKNMNSCKHTRLHTFDFYGTASPPLHTRTDL